MDGGAASLDARVREAVLKYWGFDTLRPLQREAIATALAGRDSLTVMPTGGGKSLCYQVPPLVTGALTVVVSPLIALMKDQVDGLRVAGYPVAAIHSHLEDAERREIFASAAEGELRLLLVAPERLLTPSFLSWLRERSPGAFAIDEAHCISQWGHDFRPEYRRLAELRGLFPGVPINAYTATATPRVREDIVNQLGLQRAAVMIGTFDRPNLTYRVLPRVDRTRQVIEAVKRHAGAAAIVYCISRRDTEALAEELRGAGIDARAYHAGMQPGPRSRVSEDFRAERLEVVVATVAFGMGIDRGDVRLVVHAAMPKSVEHYQQETGRAGRDGLPAECLLLYSASDAAKWRSIMERSAEESGAAPEFLDAQIALMDHMQRLSAGARCRHQAISEYFGQTYVVGGNESPPPPSLRSAPPPLGAGEGGGGGCGACDYCLKEMEAIPDAHATAQKILSAVARCGQTFGARHIADVLMGSRAAKIVQRGHHQLPTHGLLSHLSASQVMGYIDQLIDAGDLERTTDQFPVLRLTHTSVQVLRSERQGVLVEARSALEAAGAGAVRGGGGGGGGVRRDKRAVSARPLTPEEQGLFEAMRALRRSIAQEMAVPPFVILSDVTLEELARVRPSSRDVLATVRGFGAKKLEAFGHRFLAVISERGRLAGLALDAEGGSKSGRAVVGDEGGGGAGVGGYLSTGAREPRVETMDAKRLAASLFARGMPVEDVAPQIGRSVSTTMDYLAAYVESERPVSILAWVSAGEYERVAGALASSEDGRLKPVFEALGGEVPYNKIRLVAGHLKARSGQVG